MFFKLFFSIYLISAILPLIFCQPCPIIYPSNSSSSNPLRLKSFSYADNLSNMNAVVEGAYVFNRSNVHLWVGQSMIIRNNPLNIVDLQNRDLVQGTVPSLMNYSTDLWNLDPAFQYLPTIIAPGGPYDFQFQVQTNAIHNKLLVYAGNGVSEIPTSVSLKSLDGVVYGTTWTARPYNSLVSVFELSLSGIPSSDTFIVSVTKNTTGPVLLLRIELYFETVQSQCGNLNVGYYPGYPGFNVMGQWFDNSTCKWNYNITGPFLYCWGWSNTVDNVTGQVHLKNKLYAEWTDNLGANLTRYHKVNYDLKIDTDRDVTVQAAAPLFVGDMSLTIPSVIYTPPSGNVLGYVTVNWALDVPCPIVPTLQDAGVSLRSDEAGTLAAYNTDLLGFTQGNVGNCGYGIRTTTVSGTLVMNLTNSMCWADGDYVLTFSAGDGVTTFTQNFTISDNFNFCSATNLDASITATIDVYGGVNSRRLQDAVLFYGNLSSTGLPMNSVRLTQVTVLNRRPAYGTTYTHPIYTSNTATTLTSFATDTRFAAAWKYPTESPSWTNSLNLVGLDPSVYPANTGSLHYSVQVTPFGGSSLASSYVVESESGATDLAFGLRLEWRVYFSLKDREMGRRDYLLEKREAIDVQMAKDATIESVKVPLQTSSNGSVFTANVSTGTSTGMIVGIAVGGVILVAAIVTVGVIIGRRRKQAKSVKSVNSDKKFKILV